MELVLSSASNSFCPSDAKYASCSDDGTVRIWDFLRCHEERIMRGMSVIFLNVSVYQNLYQIPSRLPGISPTEGFWPYGSFMVGLFQIDSLFLVLRESENLSVPSLVNIHHT